MSPNIDMVLQTFTALLMTFAAALLLAHAEFYSLGAIHSEAQGAADTPPQLICRQDHC
jgi:hypothetical protein